MANLTRATELLGNLRSDGFWVALEGDELVLSHPRRSPSVGELAGLRQFKGELIELLREPEPAHAPDPRAPAPPPLDANTVPPWLQGPCPCPDCAREDAEERARRADRWRAL